MAYYCLKSGTTYKLPVQNVTKYYKYTYTPFTQPTLTSNGTIGGSSFAVNAVYAGYNRGASSSQAYEAFRPNTGNIWFYCDEWKSSVAIQMYFPQPMNITNFHFKVPWTWGGSGGAENTKLYAGEYQNSRDILVKDIGFVSEGGTYDSVISNNHYYQHYTLYVENQGRPDNDQLDISDIYIQGNLRGVTIGTSNNYDYIVIESTFKALKS